MTKKERHKMVPAVYAIIIRDNKILLSLRKNTGFKDGYYSLVAGHVEAKETVDEAMARELKEEANITVKLESLELATVMCRLGNEEQDDYLDFFFLVNDYEGEIKNNEEEKCGDLNFFSLDNLPSNTLDYVARAIADALAGKSYDNF